jgi:hypothetical protein
MSIDDIYGGFGEEREPVPYQDRWSASKRVGAAVSAIVTGVLAEPSVQTALTGLLPAVVPAPYLPLATAVIGAGLAIWSKASDPRPIAPKPEQRP